MNDTVKSIIAVVGLGGIIGGATYVGMNKQQPLKLEMAPPGAPIVPPVTPPTPPVPPVEPSHTPSFIKGYHDGYSGAWLAPGRWVVANEYRAGWNAGRQDKAANKPNKFVK